MEAAMKWMSVAAIALSVLIRVGPASATELRGVGPASATELRGVGPASATQLQGKVQAVDASDRAVVLKDGTRLSLAEDRMVKLEDGVTVKLSYEKRDGKHVVTSIETAE
jgi:Protein of unknown function (DUF1344)